MTIGSEDQSLLHAALLAAREAIRDVNIPTETFSAFLLERQIDLAVVNTALAQDLYLACGCGRGNAAAIKSFREIYRPLVRKVAARFDRSGAFADEVEQQLNETLLVKTAETPPRIEQYKGNGPLGAFVATAARNIANRLAQRSTRFQGEEALARQFFEAPDMETTILKNRYREIFNKALVMAIRSLPRRDRLILHWNLIGKVSTTKLAASYGVSQPTMSRWIQRSAQRIFSEAKRVIRDELDLDTVELSSIFAMVRSQIEITISLSRTGQDSRDDVP